jgi:hypothetical protein
MHRDVGENSRSHPMLFILSDLACFRDSQKHAGDRGTNDCCSDNSGWWVDKKQRSFGAMHLYAASWHGSMSLTSPKLVEYDAP